MKRIKQILINWLEPGTYVLTKVKPKVLFIVFGSSFVCGLFFMFLAFLVPFDKKTTSAIVCFVMALLGVIFTAVSLPPLLKSPRVKKDDTGLRILLVIGISFIGLVIVNLYYNWFMLP